ncbi:MAG TPA: META domain-containing protein [Propionicimonas sp.]|nr:META domain-containing protein [Propionicimonas sp.]HRA06944.1 META domain-containing protein [Propionicimonas sp.]
MKKYSIWAIGLAALLSACSTTTPAAPASAPTPAASAAALAGTSWTVTAIKGTATLDGHQPTMMFEDDSVSGLASCNRFTGGYTQDGAGLTFGTLATTAMMCTDAAVMTQEQTFLMTVPTVAGLRTIDSGLELLDASQQVALSLAPVEDKPLVGTTWKLSGVITNDAVTSPVAGSSVTVKIADGKLTGKACNNFNGSVEVTDDGSFKAGPLRSTKMACASQELSAEETAVLTTLQAATSYTIKGSTLMLKAADGTGLEFLAA